MLRDADTAMYRAKANGRSRHEVFDSDMHKRAVSLLRLETDLRRALERDELCAFYQPIVDLESKRLIGFEALARWRHPTRGLVMPDLFIPLAEETGLIGPIGHWILGEACRQTRLWQEKYPRTPPIGISVNVSTRQLAQADVAEQVQRVLVETGLDPKSLTLEITESALMQNLKASAAAIKRLHDMAVHLHIDDFGTGYSSLSYLHSFPVDTLKVDRSFVSRMNGQPQQAEIVRAIVALAQNLGMGVTAEGVETREQADALRDLHCTSAQGFLFSQPLPADEAERLLSDGLAPY
jgi:EAL domain-containing protein (putative c-di-GMP-specific phosphodiesterase class I)